MTRKMYFEDLHFLHDLATYNILNYGPFKALIYEDQEQVREYTNVEAAREAIQLAAGLRSLGVEKGDRVIVMMLNSPEVIISYQAISRAGAIIIPVMPLLKGPEVHYIAENSAAKAVITSAVLLPLLRGALADVPTMQHIIATGIEMGEGQAGEDHFELHAYKDVVARGAAYADRYLEDLEAMSSPTQSVAGKLFQARREHHRRGRYNWQSCRLRMPMGWWPQTSVTWPACKQSCTHALTLRRCFLLLSVTMSMDLQGCRLCLWRFCIPPTRTSTIRAACSPA